MTIIADLHVHTNVSNHALSTLQEMMVQAKSLGYLSMAVTDHAPAMPDSPHPWYFYTLCNLPSIVEDGFLLLKGVEANIVSADGSLDMDKWLLKSLDWVIASMHQDCIAPTDEQGVTETWLRIAQNPLVDMIGHAEQPVYPFDYERVARAFAQNNKVVEMNAASVYVRPGGQENMRRLALACKDCGTNIAISSDAHSTYAMSELSDVIKMLEEIDFPQEQIVNTSMRRLAQELQRHGRSVSEHALKIADNLEKNQT